MSRAADAWRLAVGTLTAFPVRPPAVVDSQVAVRTVLLAPVAVAPLGLVGVLVAGLCILVGLPTLVAALLVVGAVAVGTRGLHLDGLSDTADGLAASFDRARSLDVMKTGTSGPAGVVATVVVIGLQAAALASLLTSLRGAILAGVVICVSRGALALCCLRGFPPARPHGLGRTFTQSTGPAAALALWVALAVLLVGACLVAALPWWRGVLAVTLGVACVLLLLRHVVRRLGGVTGDVFGAAIEVMFAALLVSLA